MGKCIIILLSVMALASCGRKTVSASSSRHDLSFDLSSSLGINVSDSIVNSDIGIVFIDRPVLRNIAVNNGDTSMTVLSGESFAAVRSTCLERLFLSESVAYDSLTVSHVDDRQAVSDTRRSMPVWLRIMFALAAVATIIRLSWLRTHSRR